MQPGWPFHGRTDDKSIFFSINPRHLRVPGILTSLRRAVQSKKAPLPIYLRAGGMASSTRAAQLIKALTRIVWRVVGRKTSRRLVQWPKVNSGISSIMVLQRSTLLSSRQLSQACAPVATKCFGRASVQMPVELRQPGASSLVLSCRVNPFNSDRGDGNSLTVTSAMLMHPWKRYCPKLVSPLNTFTAPPDAYTLQGTTFRKGFVTKVATTRSQDTI